MASDDQVAYTASCSTSTPTMRPHKAPMIMFGMKSPVGTFVPTFMYKFQLNRYAFNPKTQFLTGAHRKRREDATEEQRQSQLP